MLNKYDTPVKPMKMNAERVSEMGKARMKSKMKKEPCECSKEELNEILNKLVARKIFRVYPDLIEATNTVVAQFEHTITPTEDGAVILTET